MKSYTRPHTNVETSESHRAIICLTFSLLLVTLLLQGCGGPRPDNSAARPTLIYVTSVRSNDILIYPDLKELITTHYNYRTKRLSGVYDRMLSERNFHYGRSLPNWRQSIDYWEYLSLRDPPGRLSQDDVAFIRKYELTQTPAFLVVYPDSRVEIFDRAMSSQMFNSLLRMKKKGELIEGELSELMDNYWRIKDPDDRNVESRTGAPALGSGGLSVAFAPGRSPAPVAAFPVPAHQTGHADFPHPAFGRDHAIACGRPLVLSDRRMRPYSSRSLVSGNRTYFPVFTLCLRQSHRRSRRTACRSIAL